MFILSNPSLVFITEDYTKKNLLSGAEHNLINIGSVVVFSYKGHGWDGYAGRSNQGVAHPDAGALAHGGDEEEEEEDHPDQVVHHGEEASQGTLVDRVGQLHLGNCVQEKLGNTVISKKSGSQEPAAQVPKIIAVERL